MLGSPRLSRSLSFRLAMSLGAGGVVEVELALLVEEEGVEVPSLGGRRVIWVTARLLLLGAAVVVAGATAAIWPGGLRGRTAGLPAADRVAGLAGLAESMKIVPSYPACSGSKENCLDTGCCQVSGHHCFLKSPTVGHCNLTCTPGVEGFQCGIPANASFSVPAASQRRTDLYCIAVYVKDTGSAKPSTELALLRAQHRYGASLFGCEAWDVFSDVTVPVGSDYSTKKVIDIQNEFHQVKRKQAGTWVNWALFFQVWLKVKEMQRWQSAGWTVKVDADAVFIPQRLRDFLSTKGDTVHGVYFENCKDVQYGFFGNLEVLSQNATKILTERLEECHAVFAPCANEGCDWEWGPWGEDVFVQRCMDHHYVDKVEGFELTKDGMCEADRPASQRKNKKWHAPDCSQVLAAAVHPFKKPEEYFKCLGAIMQRTYDVSGF